jgi:hypothetical protein
VKSTLVRKHELFAVHDSCFQPGLDELQDTAIFHPLTQDREQFVVLEIVEERADIAVDHMMDARLQSLPKIA